MGGVTVQLFSAEGNLLGVVTTDANGGYLFTDLPPGNYYLVFVLPEGYLFSPSNVELSDGNDSDADPSTGQTEIILLAPGVTDVSWYAGIYRSPTSIEGGDEPTIRQRIYLPFIIQQDPTTEPAPEREGDGQEAGDEPVGSATTPEDTVANLAQDNLVFLPIIGRTGLTKKNEEAASSRAPPNRTLERAPPRAALAFAQRAPPPKQRSHGQRSPPSSFCHKGVCFLR